MISIDTEKTIYVCTDGANGEVHILKPQFHCYSPMGIEHLRLDDPDPYGPHGDDKAIFKLLCDTEMTHITFDI
jgi:hypothetical protein